ncbi:MAG: hypothetical protein MK179_15820 [Pirellulaceae bacterium]|nr:hypothetical protein [Pirellulaceae bacterium]
MEGALWAVYRKSVKLGGQENEIDQWEDVEGTIVFLRVRFPWAFPFLFEFWDWLSEQRFDESLTKR